MLTDFISDINIHMWFSFVITIVAIALFIREKVPLEVTSVGVLTTLLLFGHLFPLDDGAGGNLLNAQQLFAGFANPALIAVLALLVMGQAIIHTDALSFVTNTLSLAKSKVWAWISILIVLLCVMSLSAFMNNTPLVIIAIPLVQSLARSAGLTESRIMMPLSFVAILGGMTTLIGSSTNLLVSDSMQALGYEPLQFFDFVIPGIMLALLGVFYVVLIAPLFLKQRGSMAGELRDNQKEFVAELDVHKDSKLIGLKSEDGKFSDFPDLKVKLVQRAGQLILPPFENYEIEADDILIVAATRDTLMELLSKYPGFLLSEEETEAVQKKNEELLEFGPLKEGKMAETRVMAELMITPASRMVDMSLEHVSFHRQFGAIVLGVQRRARVVRRRLGRIRLEAGDVLLVAGKRSVIDSMRSSADFIVLSGSKRDLPVLRKGPIAGAIFAGTIASAAFGYLSIPVAALVGAALMIVTGCLNIHQATRAIDRKIFLLVGSMLALGATLQASGGAEYLANLILSAPFVDSPLVMVSLLFLIVAIATNILSNNACAILFTPIAMNLGETFQGAYNFDMAFIMAVTVIFGANCSFASPIGYQTNLLVMGPGHYRFRDFLKAGVPLVVIMWLGFTAMAKFYFGL